MTDELHGSSASDRPAPIVASFAACPMPVSFAQDIELSVPSILVFYSTESLTQSSCLLDQQAHKRTHKREAIAQQLSTVR